MSLLHTMIHLQAIYRQEHVGRGVREGGRKGGRGERGKWKSREGGAEVASYTMKL